MALPGLLGHVTQGWHRAGLVPPEQEGTREEPPGPQRWGQWDVSGDTTVEQKATEGPGLGLGAVPGAEHPGTSGNIRVRTGRVSARKGRRVGTTGAARAVWVLRGACNTGGQPHEGHRKH